MAAAGKGMGSMMTLGSVPGTAPFDGSDSDDSTDGAPTLASLQEQIDDINERLDKANIPAEDDDNLGDDGGDSIASAS